MRACALIAYAEVVPANPAPALSLLRQSSVLRLLYLGQRLYPFQPK